MLLTIMYSFVSYLNIVRILFNLVRYQVEAKRGAIVYVLDSCRGESRNQLLKDSRKVLK